MIFAAAKAATVLNYVSWVGHSAYFTIKRVMKIFRYFTRHAHKFHIQLYPCSASYKKAVFINTNTWKSPTDVMGSQLAAWRIRWCHTSEGDGDPLASFLKCFGPTGECEEWPDHILPAFEEQKLCETAHFWQLFFPLCWCKLVLFCSINRSLLNSKLTCNSAATLYNSAVLCNFEDSIHLQIKRFLFYIM